jgi:hypothetical protein
MEDSDDVLDEFLVHIMPYKPTHHKSTSLLYCRFKVRGKGEFRFFVDRNGWSYRRPDLQVRQFIWENGLPQIDQMLSHLPF